MGHDDYRPRRSTPDPVQVADRKLLRQLGFYGVRSVNWLRTQYGNEFAAVEKWAGQVDKFQSFLVEYHDQFILVGETDREWFIARVNDYQRKADKEAYASLADELNDSPPEELHVSIDDFDHNVRIRGERYARQHSLPWPPEVGDFDRFCEEEERQRRIAAAQARRNA